MATFGQAISSAFGFYRVAGTELGLTQENLAKKIGVKQQVISRFEQEKHTPTLDNFIRILDGIGLELVLQKKRETNTILPK